MLLALRFVPIGLAITVFVLLLQSRGLSLAQIGVATAAQGIVMLFLELPTGGLADAVGRKPVLVVSVVVWMLATALLLVADTVLLLAVVSALMGVFRALDSGPLQAWFVDASLEADPDADLDRGLAHSDVVICSSIGGGALVGGFLASTSGFAGIDPLVVPLVFGLVLQAVGLVALVVLVHEHREGDRLGGRARVGARGALGGVGRGAADLAEPGPRRARVRRVPVGLRDDRLRDLLPAAARRGLLEPGRRHPPARVLDHGRLGAVGGRRRVRAMAGAAVRRAGGGLRPAGRSRA